MTKYLEREFRDRLDKILVCIKDSNIEYVRLGIFGSYARGTANGCSDIDVCVVVNEKPPRRVSGVLRCDAEDLGVDIIFVTEKYLNEDTSLFAKNLRRDWRDVDV